MNRARSLVLLAAAALATPGCVERMLLLRSDPEGLDVSVNGVPAGKTPVEIPFVWYGTVRLETAPADQDGDGWPELRRLVTGEDLPVPWYERFPVDFITENLLPFTVVDRHEVMLRPARSPAPETEAEIEALRRAAPALKVRAEKARVEAEAQGEADARAAKEADSGSSPPKKK